MPKPSRYPILNSYLSIKYSSNALALAQVYQTQQKALRQFASVGSLVLKVDLLI